MSGKLNNSLDEGGLNTLGPYPEKDQPGDDGTNPPISPIGKIIERTKTATTAVLTGAHPMSTQTLAHQIELLNSLKQYLRGFQERLQGVANNYQTKVGELHGAGMMDEVYRSIEQELVGTQSFIATLIERIEHSDIARIERNIRSLEEAIARLQAIADSP
ncbi:hypothetical protein TI04_02940 [Achromatium sp. WMS2]|nr:hypothetical protein TI04_02940 [Achromatium sp. WMS2]